MAYTDIDKPTDYFETTTYAGGTTSITSLDFSPDWVWAKKRTGVENHGIFDSVRGATKTINSNTNSAETTRGGSLTSFDSNGWSMGGADGIISASGNDYVAWAWRGSDSTAVSNTDGSITSTVSANTTAGFSIVKYTGNGTAGATIGHGLSSVPNVVLIKALTSSTQQWNMYHSSLGNGSHMHFNLTNAVNSSSTYFNNTTPTSSVFSVGSYYETNESSTDFIAYCFVQKKGFSKFGSYTGNGSNDGTFVYTGFKPAFCIVKRTDGSADWNMYDNKRIGYNPLNYFVYPNSSSAEDTSNPQWFDLLSNGFQLRNTSTMANTSGGSYIYMAFAENPFVTSGGIPTTAR